jgi:membrane associated rhomboid family serine protease
MTMIAVLVLLGAVYYFTTPEEKARCLRASLRVIGRWKDLAVHLQAERGPFGDALRERTPRALVTPGLVVLNITIFVSMLFGAGALSDPNTVVGWGGNFGPRTTNGEWWRLVTATFVHSGALHLIANIAGLVQVGLILERLLGRVAFASVYLAAGLTSSLVSLFMHPVNVIAGASGSIFGVYGLFVASLIPAIVVRSTLTVPLMSLLKLVPAAGVFVLYSVAAGFNGAPEMTGLAVGFVCGLALTKDIAVRTPPLLRVAATMGVVVVLAIGSAIPLRGVADVKAEIERVATFEQRTAGSYDNAVRRFRNGEISIRALSDMIDRIILPELRAARGRLTQLERERVPPEQQPLVMAANEYFRLREESWRVRAEALRKTSTARLQQADEAERVSLRALEKAIPSTQE